MDALYFLRPYGFFIIIPLMLVWFWLHRHENHKQWVSVCDAHLLAHLIDERSASRAPIVRFIIFSLFLAMAVSGPTWRQLPTPVFKNMTTRIIVFGLAPSLYAQDLKPSRLVRARYKLTDLLKQAHEGQTGLIVYGNEPYVVAPVTEDTNTLINLVPVLEPAILPSGSSVIPANAGISRGLAANSLSLALKHAEQLIEQANQSRGHIIIITDQDASEDSIAYAKKLRQKNIQVSVMALGTKQGAPIPLPQGDFLKDGSGNMILAKLKTTTLKKMAKAGGGTFVHMHSTTSDIKELLNTGFNHETKESHNDATLWKDEGAWFILGMLPFVLMGFRRCQNGVPV